ncbi:uteroferrin-associated basic protein 2-like [Hyaena hyaena]|uniref:uteroferrin-associated basic protein 2-like n=1 Tax=Hyaena hyaena TaxID=95912 RepID=UPI001922A40C|nr:uteroferrin-associated basic protein 2-like [Hyaena hyaena]
MVSLGTRSTTLTNLLKGLGFDLKVIRVWDIHQGFQSVVQMLSQLNREGHLRHRDILFIDGNRQITSMFLWDTEGIYDVKAHMIDFRDAEKTKKQINHFVADKMHKRTKEFITSLNPHTFLFLVNYVFFKGIWEMAFHTHLMYKENFFVDEHTTVQVDMMWKTEQMIYSRSEELFATMVKIPYIGNMSIVLMLPDVGKPDPAIKDMIVQKATLLKSSDMRNGSQLPPTCRQPWRELASLPRAALGRLGMRPDLCFSRLSELTPRAETGPASPQAMHEATMEVSKEGKMDALKDVNSDNVIPLHTHTAAPLVVKFNRPFFLLVEDWMTQRALLMGKVFNPTAE